MVFLPELIRSHDVVNRFMQNGAIARTLAKIAAFHRVPVKDKLLSRNSMSKIIQHAMRRRHDDDCTETRHHRGHYGVAGQLWNAENLTLAGVINSYETDSDEPAHQRSSVANVLFSSLVNGVAVFPSGSNALDLTDCVKIAVANEELPLMFPRDFDWLTKFRGGQKPVLNDHRDREAFGRWAQVSGNAMPSPQQVQTAYHLDELRFSPEQMDVAKQYLSQFPDVDTPVQYGVRCRSVPQPPPVAVAGQEPNLRALLPLLGGQPHSMADVDLERAVSQMSEEQMGACYERIMKSHGFRRKSEDDVAVQGGQRVRIHLQGLERAFPAQPFPTPMQHNVTSNTLGRFFGLNNHLSPSTQPPRFSHSNMTTHVESSNRPLVQSTEKAG